MIPCLGEAGYPDFKDGAGVLWQYDVKRDCYLVAGHADLGAGFYIFWMFASFFLWFGGPGGILIGLIVFCLALKGADLADGSAKTRENAYGRKRVRWPYTTGERRA